MLLSELAIIYLAAAAPFGVARYLRDHSESSRAPRRLAKAAAAALGWPLAAPRLLLERARRAKSRGKDEARAYDGQRVELVKRSAVNSLREVEDSLAESRGRDLREAERHALFAARGAVERYAGLSLACASESEHNEEAPSERELELCRIAGRSGDDLLVAGICVHRRSVTRLLAHRERARSELIHALADACEVAHDAGAGRTHGVAQGDAAGRVSESVLRALARAIELMSLFDDRAAVVSAARLLDAECARLRRVAGTRAESEPPDGRREGAEPCTTRAAHTAFATPRPPTMTST
jgi:hypothetical protein